MNKDTLKELTLMLMYLTSWEESLVPGIRKKPDHAGIYPKARICWKGYDFDILNELTDEGLVNAGGRSKSASFADEGEAKALELLKQYGITVDQQDEKEAGVNGSRVPILVTKVMETEGINTRNTAESGPIRTLDVP